MSEMNQLLENSCCRENKDEKKLRCNSLKYANRDLESKLKKLKILYEKKCAQYEAAMATLSIERDLYQVNILDCDNQSAIMDEAVPNLEKKMHQLTIEEREKFTEHVISQTLELLDGVKSYANEGVISGEIMSHCVDILQQENPDVLFVDWTITQDLLNATDDATIQRFISDHRVDEFNNWFLILNDSSHWSLMLFVKTKRAFFHYDSKPNRNHNVAQKIASALADHTDSEQFFEVLCNPQEAPNVSAFHVIENITKLLPILEEGRIVIGDVEVTLEKISLLKMLQLKCRVLVMKLYLQKKLQILNELFAT